MGFGQRAGNFNELGRINSIRPSSGTPMTQVESYEITSSGQPASVIHARDPIFKPGTETVLDANATFFEPVESYDAKGVPQYSQFVVNANVGSSLLVSQYKELFPVTKPGTMTIETRGYAWSGTGGSGTAATLVPIPSAEPRTFRKNARVQVTLTTSDDTTTEVAFNDSSIDFAAATFTTLNIQDTVPSSATMQATYRFFNKYLKGSISAASVTSSGDDFDQKVFCDFSGSTSYTETGIYRSRVTPFERKVDGTQMYLRTDVEFS